MPTNFGIIGKQAPRIKPNSVEHLRDTMNSIKPKNVFLRARIGKLKEQTARKKRFITAVNDIKSTIESPFDNKSTSRDKMMATEAKLYQIKTARGMGKSSPFKSFRDDALNFKHEILKLQNIEKLEMAFLSSQQKIHDSISSIRRRVDNRQPFDATKVEELRSNVKKIDQTYRGVAHRVEQSMKFALPMRIEEEGKLNKKRKLTFMENTGHRRSKSERLFKKPLSLERKKIGKIGRIPSLDFRVCKLS